MDYSRRSFIKGSLAAGALAVGGAALAGCSPQDNVPSSASSTESAGRWSWSIAPEPIAESDIANTYDCEVCVVGAGVAGNPASLYAAMQGLDVVVLQKGSKNQVNGQECGVWNSRHESEFGIKTDILASLQKFAEFANGKSNIKLVRTVMSRTGEAMEWITDTITDPPASLSPVDDRLRYRFLFDNDVSTRYKGFMQFHDNIVAKATELGAQYLYETPAVQLVTDDSGSVTGVIGQAKDGSYVQVNASKGVILCTGDVSDDDEMIEAYCPAMIDIPSMHGAPCNTGDGLKMGMWIGASTDNPPAGMQMHLAPSTLEHGTAPFSGVPWLHVNLKGERFTNENVNFQSIATAISLQPEHRAFQIIDSHLMEHAQDYKNGGRPGSQEDLEAAVEEGSILKADSLDELASLAGLPVDAVKKTVERYNELVAKGSDDDFGVSSDVFVWNGINDAPFYAIERLPSKLVAAPGLTCNENLQVLDKNLEPIGGLYAAGNTQGSFFGYDYPVTGFSGFSNSRSVTGGILAVKSLMGTLDEPIA